MKFNINIKISQMGQESSSLPLDSTMDITDVEECKRYLFYQSLLIFCDVHGFDLTKYQIKLISSPPSSQVWTSDDVVISLNGMIIELFVKNPAYAPRRTKINMESLSHLSQYGFYHLMEQFCNSHGYEPSKILLVTSRNLPKGVESMCKTYNAEIYRQLDNQSIWYVQVNTFALYRNTI